MIENIYINLLLTYYKLYIKLLTENIVIASSIIKSVKRSLISVVFVTPTLKRSITHIMDIVSLLMQDLRSLATKKAFYEPIVLANNVYKSLTRIIYDNIIITNIIIVGELYSQYFIESLTLVSVCSKQIVRSLIDTITAVSIKGNIILFRNVIQLINITLDFRRAHLLVLIQSIIITPLFNWVRPTLRTVKYTVSNSIKKSSMIVINKSNTAATSIKKATKMFLGGEELE